MSGDTLALVPRSALLCGLLFVLLLSACASRQGPPASDLDLRRVHRVHRVRAGDTAYGIAKQYGVTIEEIAALNELEDASKLAIDQELLIPGPRPPGTPDEPPPEAVPPAPIASDREIALECGAPSRPQVRVSKEGFAWPVDGGVVIAKFGTIEGLPHEGLDIAAPAGTPIRSARAGKILFSGQQPGYGNIVIVAHDDDMATIYANNAKNCVQEGQDVPLGAVVGLVGATGGVASPRVYFELRAGPKPVDPKRYLPR